VRLAQQSSPAGNPQSFGQNRSHGFRCMVNPRQSMSPELRDGYNDIRVHLSHGCVMCLLQQHGQVTCQWNSVPAFGSNTGLPQFVLVQSQSEDPLKSIVAAMALKAAAGSVHMRPDGQPATDARPIIIQKGSTALSTQSQRVGRGSRMGRSETECAGGWIKDVSDGIDGPGNDLSA